jgi:hypothetical protein
MVYYYVTLGSKSHAFYLEQRMKMNNIQCELTYMPREIMIDVCNMGVRFPEAELQRAIAFIGSIGLPGCKIFRQNVSSQGYTYEQIFF